MSTRILVWNIERFSINKLQAGPEESPVLSSTGNTAITATQKGAYRLAYILANVALKNPDIFVVIEVGSGEGDWGSLVTAGGAQASQILLTNLRLSNNNWCLVPPLKLIDQLQIDKSAGYKKIHGEKSYTEAVSVYYRADRVNFIGPYIWPASATPGTFDPRTKAVPDTGTNTAGPYPPNWQACLPANNYYAGQFEFYAAPNDPILFPSVGSRSPFLVKFREEETGRLLSLYCAHFPPKLKSASQALGKLTEYVQAQPLAADEIVMILGDININGTTPAIHDMSVIGNTSKLLTPVFDSKSNLKTSMYLKRWEARPQNYLWPNNLLDNVFYRYGEDLMQVDVVGEIIDRVANASLLNTPMANILASNNPNRTFRRFLNFGKLGPSPGGTSDHLALFVQV